MRTSVTIYEDNAGSIFLHAQDGAVVYESIQENAVDEVGYVSLHPNGDPTGIDWSTELQEPQAIGPAMTPLATLDALGYLTIHREHPGTAGKKYLAQLEPMP